jgi:dolichyl-phosphate-mannose-protein mannosyltransferase
VLRGDLGISIAVRNNFLYASFPSCPCILRVIFHCVYLAKVVKYDSLIGFLFIGWGLHYFPFFLMRRQLFLHHYFPALYFAILLSCVLFDLGTSTLRPRTRLQIAAVLVILAIWNYQHLSPLTYGSPWTRSKCQNAKWLKTWDFSWYVHLIVV